jgi:hypothetical protein
MIDYKETHFKNGKHVIFCNIEDLLKEYYHEDNMTSIQEHLEPNGKNWVIHCPWCKEAGHRKHKLYIDSDCSRGFCFVCGRIYINIDDEVKFTTNLESEMSKVLSDFKLVELSDDGMWNLAKYYTEFDDYSEKGVNYLKSRNPFLGSLWETLGIKFFNDNIVLPFKDPDGNLVYYQLRFTDAGKDGIRYFFPPIKSKPPYIIQSQESDPEKLIIVEGVFDAIAAFIQCGGKYTIVAVLGSKISDYQLEYIRNWYMPKKILVWMDETELSKGICKRLKSVFNYSVVGVIKSEGPDPEEILMQKMRTGQEIVWIKEETGDQKIKFRSPFLDGGKKHVL